MVNVGSVIVKPAIVTERPLIAGIRNFLVKKTVMTEEKPNNIAVNSLIGFTGDLGHFVIEWKLLLVVTLIAIIGILIGGQLAKKIEGEKLKKAFAWFILIMGIYIIAKETLFH